MSTEPWEEQVFPEEEQEATRKNRKKSNLQTPVLTILLSIFFVIFVGILLFVFYTSNGGTSHEEATTGFYGASTNQNDAQSTEIKTTSKVNLESEETGEVRESETEAVVRNGGTTVVEAGEGAGSIADRVGISLEKLYALNPEKMTGPGGTWWANPGDVVYID